MAFSVLLMASLAVTGCVAPVTLGYTLTPTTGVTMQDPETSQVQQGATIFTLPADGSAWAGQSFTSRRGGLNSVTITIELVGAQQAELQANLISAHSDARTHSYKQTVQSGPVTFQFTDNPLPGEYTLQLTAQGAPINLIGREDDFYPGGTALAGSGSDPGTPLQGDLAFSTSYEYNFGEVWLDLLALLGNTWLSIPLAAVVILPGASLIVLLGWGKTLDLGEWLGYSCGLSLAILPLIMLWTGLVGVQWSSDMVKIVTVVLAVALMLMIWKGRLWQGWKLDGLDFGLGAVFVGSLLLRLAMARDMAGPAWVDGIHHGLITRLIMEHGTLPLGFAPFFEMNPTEYHPGFHVGLASFLWLSGSDLMAGMLIYGQVLNALTVSAVYLFTKSLTGSRQAALAAALFCGFCTPMPAYYTSWSRYTQLAGLIVLPVILAAFTRRFTLSSTAIPEASGKSASNAVIAEVKMLLPAVLAGAGLVLIHYRVAAFCALLMLCWYVFQTWKDHEKNILWLETLKLAVLAAFTAGLAALPWLVPLITNTLLEKKVSSASPVWFNDFSWRYLTTGLGQPVIALSGMGLVFGLFYQKRFTWTVLAWVFSLAVLANPGAIGLPLVFSNNITMEITLFIPLCALAGYAVAISCQAAIQLSWTWYKFALAAMAILTAVLGAQQLLPILNEGTMLVRQADLAALDWAAKNLPAQAYVATNPFVWGYGNYAGADGGYWLAPQSNIRSFPPPVAAYTDNEFIQNALRISQAITEKGSNAESFASFLRQEGFSHVFSGQRGGPISPLALAASPNFKTLYHQESVWIFYIVP